MADIVHNAIKTPDGTIIESRHRWDYVLYEDANGKTYMIDGGLDYVRCHIVEDQVMLTLTLNDPHVQVRQVVTWGTYGKEGIGKLTYVKIADMSSEHLRNCLDNAINMYPQIRQVMKNELSFRKLTDGCVE